MNDEAAVLYTTWPDAESAAEAGRILIEERLCACANILAPMRSIYRWNNAVEDGVEIPALFKTTAERAPSLRDRILALHPYETACVLMLPIAARGSAAPFMDWIVQNVTPIHE